MTKNAKSSDIDEATPRRPLVSVDTDYAAAIIFLFLGFYIAGGWERIDCALDVRAACENVSSWYRKDGK